MDARRNFEEVSSRLVSGLLILVILLALLVIPRTGSAKHPEEATFGEVDRFIQDSMRANRIPGLSIAIVQGDQIVYLRGYGRAALGVDWTADTPTYLGSVSKSITALAVMQLVEQGKLQLDTPIQEYLSWFRVADPGASKAITVLNLLNHTSGLSELGYVARLRKDATLQKAVAELSQARPIERVGAQFHYFNENYDILGLLVETVSGVPYAQYVQDNIFIPLDMRRSFADPIQAERAGVAQGHGVLFGFPIPRDEAHPVSAAPSGHIVSTAEDMSHFLIAQLNGGGYKGKQVLSKEGINDMHTPPAGIASGYAMGWRKVQFDGTTALTHDGMLMNYSADAWLLPELQIGFVILINQTGLLHSMMAFPELSDGILKILVQEPATAGMSMSIVDSVLGVIALLIAGFGVRWWFVTLPAWKILVPKKSRAYWIAGILSEFLVPLVLYFGIPYLFLTVSEKRLYWERGFGLAPALYALLIFVILNGIAKGLAKAWVVYTSSRTVYNRSMGTSPMI